jgi:hypothetical protein
VLQLPELPGLLIARAPLSYFQLMFTTLLFPLLLPCVLQVPELPGLATAHTPRYVDVHHLMFTTLLFPLLLHCVCSYLSYLGFQLHTHHDCSAHTPWLLIFTTPCHDTVVPVRCSIVCCSYLSYLSFQLHTHPHTMTVDVHTSCSPRCCSLCCSLVSAAT